MSIENAREYLKKYNLESRMRIFDRSTATVEEAACVNGCEMARIGKTMSFWIKDEPAVILVSGDGRINNQKFKACFHTKAKMISGDEVEKVIGHPVGGVCPFGVNKNVKIYLDISIKRFPTVIPACGGPNTAIELTIDEVERVSNSDGWVDICQKF